MLRCESGWRASKYEQTQTSHIASPYIQPASSSRSSASATAHFDDEDPPPPPLEGKVIQFFFAAKSDARRLTGKSFPIILNFFPCSIHDSRFDSPCGKVSLIYFRVHSSSRQQGGKCVDSDDIPECRLEGPGGGDRGMFDCYGATFRRRL